MSSFIASHVTKHFMLSLRKFPFIQDKIILPPESQFDEIVESVFWASLSKEESRSLSFRLCYYSSECDLSTHVQYGNSYLLIFNDPKQFNAYEIRKLAPALDSDKSMICIKSSNTTSSALVITGILITNSTYIDMRSGSALSGYGLPQLLNLESKDNATISFNYGDFNLLNYVKGRFICSTDELSSHNQILESLKATEELIHLIACQELSDEDKSEFADMNTLRTISLYSQFLTRLIYKIKDINHGGTILILPDNEADQIIDNSTLLKIKYPMNCDVVWRKLIDWVKCLRSDGTNNNELSVNHERLITLADSFGNFSAVDGAVIITDHFRLLGFGAELLIHDNIFNSVFISDDNLLASEIRSIEEFGTRHRSAFRFCNAIDNSIAVIISQDGGIKYVKKICEQIEVMSRLLP